ncbi:glyoxalase [Bhargavaea ullalensis]|uniref:Catechol 2,3-dioxygenase-like lactoylglutathione lyase family enzyme n=1 Tax=Bhargavaea ullalensis TaxID=1265685 RepID=A0ABV2GCF7_9BACL
MPGFIFGILLPVRKSHTCYNEGNKKVEVDGLFKSVRFYTNRLAAMRRFYGNILELEISERLEDSFTVKIGGTDVTFVASERPSFYHFAINIPGNQFTMLKYWVKDRVPLNWDGGVDEVYFRSFDADSMYFEDPSGNIVELIGRRKKDLFGDVSRASFLNISEVGVVPQDVVKAGTELQKAGIPLRGGTDVDPDSLNFLGRGETFFVLVPEGRRWYFSKRTSEIHPLEALLDDGLLVRLDEAGELAVSDTED